MKQQQLINLFEDTNIVIPLVFFKKYKDLSLSLEELVFLMYLRGKGKVFTFDPNNMALELNYTLVDILKIISTLCDKKLLVIETYKNDKGIVEEKINLELFYEKFTSVLLNETMEKEDKKDDVDIYATVEKEFGRTLSSSETLYIKAWSENFNSDIIVEAVKEATLNGVASIRYIDRILYEWDKKGIKTKEDVSHFLNKKNKELKEPVEVFDYDWFEDDDANE